ncbi:tetratricopeptide repeat protein [Alkalitalea saponilacus]|uniref:Tetratricopeptide repeat-containing protein n=1 Tax=Alkalitalea saponilacus TaxID=889453 RepID=A0A1T5HSK4_9BACT|nr:tetratricopeptide repeat protein [Alkalitalea saponilacus]ASB47743.1 hypothetical protein CDL62_00535 [Alkalitalea saponilacus]SKC23674.1 Tetratricopeptide repeat-containing protein [Alkalitalea saponilacus]
MVRKLYILLIPLLLAAPVKAQIDTDRMTIIGRNALFFEDYILAIQYFNQVIRTKPYLSRPYLYRAQGKYYLDDLKGAEADCSLALDRNPFFVDAYNLRGIIRQRLGRTNEAIADFRRGLEIDPENVNLITNIGIAYINAEEYEKAVETYSQAIRLAPNLVNAWLNRGHAKVSAGDTIGGLSDFTRAIEINPYIPEGFTYRAIVNYQLSEFEKSLEDLNEAIRLRPEDGRLFMTRGFIRYQLDDLRGTVEDFDKVIELEPRNALAYHNRGILRAQVGDLNRAIDDFSRVLALRSDDLLTLYNRALLYMETGQLENALADLDIVADNHPDFAPVYYNRSQVKHLLGDRRGAELDYGTAMSLEMDRRQASDRAETIGSNESEDEETGGRKATRRESDRDIRNYDRIAVLDDFGSEQPEELAGTSLRGRIQYRNVVIDLEPVFGLTYYPGDTLVHRLRYFNIDLDGFNRRRITDRPLQISNREKELERTTSAGVFEEINRLTTYINENPDSRDIEGYLLARGALYQSVLNLNNAMNDYNRVLEINPENYLALLNRAYARFKMVELVRSLDEETPESPQRLDVRTTTTRPPTQPSERERRILDYDLIISDLQKIKTINPDFAFAHFNIGMIYATQRNFEEALLYFSQAIELSPDFGEAWFNRGLIRIFMEQEIEGTLDLSKAGELGIFEAYNVIKRYGIGPGSMMEEEE